MHRLSRLRIRNFRACKDISLPLEGYTPFVGQNNAGKSSILQAISWILKPAALSSGDFHDPDQPVEVVACVDGMSDEVLDRIPEARHRRAIAPYCRDSRLWIRSSATGTTARTVSKEVWELSNVRKMGGQTIGVSTLQDFHKPFQPCCPSLCLCEQCTILAKIWA